ncbi:MAG: hypothetical protein ACNI25_00490 [Halarcobacter sp.]
MRLLVFDKDHNQIDGDSISILSKSLKDYSITLTTDIADAKKLYESNKFDILIIDFTTDSGKEFLDFVMEVNKHQRVITIGYELTHSEKQGCEYCEENYLRKRLVKPISIVNLYKTIINFDNIRCEYRDKFSDPVVIVEQLLNKYNYFKFDESKSILYTYADGTRVLRQYLDLINDLQAYGIKYKIVDDKTIKVLSK